MNISSFISSNLLNVAVPNDNPIYFAGKTIAMTAFKITPKNFQALVLTTADSSIFATGATDEASAVNDDPPYRML